MAKRQHICDVPDCKAPRKRWQRICELHFRRLPLHIRDGIITAHRERRFADHRKWKRTAEQWLTENPTKPNPKTTSQQSYQQTAKLLGERTE